ncbi:MAG: hypothetical protein V8T01_01850 [Oscillospiraceae bacterium]
MQLASSDAAPHADLDDGGQTAFYGYGLQEEKGALELLGAAFV